MRYVSVDHQKCMALLGKSNWSTKNSQHQLFKAFTTQMIHRNFGTDFHWCRHETTQFAAYREQNSAFHALWNCIPCPISGSVKLRLIHTELNQKFMQNFLLEFYQPPIKCRCVINTALNPFWWRYRFHVLSRFSFISVWTSPAWLTFSDTEWTQFDLSVATDVRFTIQFISVYQYRILKTYNSQI